MYQLLNVSILLKEETDSTQLIEAVKCAQRNQVSIGSYIQTMITRMRRKLSDTESLYEMLSAREKLYVKLYCETLSPTQIALRMNVSISTVNSFKEKVLHKFSLVSVHELIQFCAHDDMMRQYIPNPKPQTPNPKPQSRCKGSIIINKTIVHRPWTMVGC